MDDYGVSPSSPSSICEKYDVFLSFKGTDTRHNFISHLFAALTRKQIKTYIDEESLEKEDDINIALPEAIQKSKIAIIIFSKDYASSTWCLRELERILECRRENKQMVITIFYEVYPSDIREQKESYEKPFIDHENRFKDKMEMVNNWRVALTESADLSGWISLVTRPDTKLIEEVVEDVLKKLRSTVLSSADGLKGKIGMEERCTQLESRLSIGSANTRIISLWGMGGIGKTTLAEAVYGRIFSHFESCCLLKNVREESERAHDGLEKLRKKLFAKLLGEKTVDLETQSSLEIIKRRLRSTRVLIVLDDVSKSEQLEHLVGDGDFFASGSRILLTTRDQKVHRMIKGSDKVEISEYKVELLNDSEALDLFNFTAFVEGKPPTSEYAELSKQAVSYAGSIPLAIKVVGSELRSLREPNKDKWKMTLEKLKMSPHEIIRKVLTITYEGLEKNEKNIFLDIACFFKGERRDFVENILNECNFFASTGIDNLIDKSLITIDPQGNKLQMHDLVQDIGQDIVCQESEKPGKRSRLWITEEIIHVLENNVGTANVQGLFLDYSEIDEDIYLEPTIFEKMCNLRLLKIVDHSFRKERRMYLQRGLQYLPNSLEYLEWYTYPLESLPPNFKPKNLVELKMQFSELKQLWDGGQVLEKLRSIDLSGSSNIEKLLDLPNNIEILKMSFTTIKELDFRSIEDLKLRILDLSHCQSLESLPPRIFELRFLDSLVLSGCTKLKSLPDISKPMESLTNLCIDGTDISELPPSFGNLIGLRSLSAKDCTYLEFDPEIIFNMPKLAVLDLSECPKLGSFPFHGVDLARINVSWTDITKIPESIQDASKLRELFLFCCCDLRSLPALPLSLESLGASRCTSLEEVSISERALTQEFANNYPITKSALVFLDCLKLGQKALDDIITEFQRRVLLMATRFASLELQEKNPQVFTCFPGNEIPEWFNRQSEGCRIEFPLPHNNFLGFVLCAVGAAGNDDYDYYLDYLDYLDYYELDLVCELNLKTNQGEKYNCMIPGEKGYSILPIDSDHLYMWFEPQDYSEYNYTDGVSVSFAFSFVKRNGQESQDFKVTKCGIHVVYSKDLKKCNLTPSEAKEKARNKSAATLDKSKSSGPTKTDEFTTLDELGSSSLTETDQFTNLDKPESSTPAKTDEFTVRPPITLVYSRKKGRRGNMQEPGKESGNMGKG